MLKPKHSLHRAIQWKEFEPRTARQLCISKAPVSNEEHREPIIPWPLSWQLKTPRSWTWGHCIAGLAMYFAAYMKLCCLVNRGRQIDLPRVVVEVELTI